MRGIFSGLQKLISGFQTIINGIKLFIEFIGNIIKSILDLFQLLGTIITNTTNLIITLPSWLIAFASATLGVAVLYMILGRNTGKNGN